MGMYARITEQLENERERRSDIMVELLASQDIDTSNRLAEELMDIDQSIGELEGALMEMAEVDGYGTDDYGEWLDTFAEDFDGYYDPNIDDCGEGGYICE